MAPRALIESKVATLRRKLDPGWTVVETPDKEATGGRRVELARTLEFGKGKQAFAAAVKFMASLVNEINRINHHPRWENEWVKLRVRLTTHDCGSRLSALDFAVAKLIDARFRALRKK